MRNYNLPYPPHIDLARLPTPIQLLRRFSEKLGIKLYIKRDDLTGVALSGNKIRKLEFVLADDWPVEADPHLVLRNRERFEQWHMLENP